jgi:hypothetical protein
VSDICRISRLVSPINRSYNSISKDEASDPPCPGLASQDSDGIKEELADLIDIAEADGAAAREPALQGVSWVGNRYECIKCGKAGRRDRVLGHVIYNHFGLKTWTCPLWFVCFH